MRRYLIHLSYYGTKYRGFQKQNLNGAKECDDTTTICGLLELALKGCRALNYPTVVGSSRTDSGVHALANTVHVDLDGDPSQINSFSIAKAVNIFFAEGDHDIRVVKVQQVAEDFHCRFNARGRKYLYRFALPKNEGPFYERIVIPYPISEFKRCLFLQHHKFDVEAVKSACSLFLGEKDFKSLSSVSRNRWYKQPNTVRSLNSLDLSSGRPMLPLDTVSEQFNFWDITCSAKSFLYHQVRRIVSSLLAYGQGRVTLTDLQRLFDEPGDKSWQAIGPMVPPDGLYLTKVEYDAEDLAFNEKGYCQQLQALRLEEEAKEILGKLKLPETTILEKIELRKRLMEIKAVTF